MSITRFVPLANRIGFPTRTGFAGSVADPSHPDVIRYRDLCFAFNAEDRKQLEGVQKGLKTRHRESGPLAPPDFEGTIWDFYQYMAAKLGSDAELASAELISSRARGLIPSP